MKLLFLLLAALILSSARADDCATAAYSYDKAKVTFNVTKGSMFIIKCPDDDFLATNVKLTVWEDDPVYDDFVGNLPVKFVKKLHAFKTTKTLEKLGKECGRFTWTLTHVQQGREYYISYKAQCETKNEGMCNCKAIQCYETGTANFVKDMKFKMSHCSDCSKAIKKLGRRK